MQQTLCHLKANTQQTRQYKFHFSTTKSHPAANDMTFLISTVTIKVHVDLIAI